MTVLGWIFSGLIVGAIARLLMPGRQPILLLEFDRGTESPTRLALKLAPYERLALLENRPDLLLSGFPDLGREASARKALRKPGRQLATTSWDRVVEDPLARAGDRSTPACGSDARPTGHRDLGRGPRMSGQYP